VVLFDHWRIQTLIGDKGEYEEALDLAVRAVFEVRKPAYMQLPQRICLHEDLIRIYIGSDPAGHADLIRDAIEYMETEITPDMACGLCLQARRTEFALELGHLEEAHASALRNLSISAANDHYLAAAYMDLCQVAYRTGNWAEVQAWAREGEEVARRTYSARPLIPECLAWQAAAARYGGDGREAPRLYRAAVAASSRLGGTPSRSYFDALTAYHEAGAELERALQVRARQLVAVAGKGQIANEFHCRLQRCQLLARLGRPMAGELEAAQQIALRLADPRPALADLAALPVASGSRK
jgi:hypothetical protein